MRIFRSFLTSLSSMKCSFEGLVSMNANVITMGEHCRTLIWCIHDCVCHWWQHSNKFVISNRATTYDHCIEDNRFFIYWCVVGEMYYNMSWSWGSMRGTWIDRVQKKLMIYKEQYGNRVFGKQILMFDSHNWSNLSWRVA